MICFRGLCGVKILTPEGHLPYEIARVNIFCILKGSRLSLSTHLFEQPSALSRRHVTVTGGKMSYDE